MRNCTRDEGRPFEVGDQVADPNPLQAAVVKSDGGERCRKVGTMIPAGKVERGERKFPRTAAILILTICHGGCEGGGANAKVVSRFCQEGNTRKTGVDRSRSKKRARAAVLLMACSQRSWVSSATVWKVNASRLRVARTADRCCFPWPKLCSRL